MHVESSQTKDQTYVPCFSRWILNHWTQRSPTYILISWGYGTLHCLSEPYLNVTKLELVFNS